MLFRLQYILISLSEKIKMSKALLLLSENFAIWTGYLKDNAQSAGRCLPTPALSYNVPALKAQNVSWSLFTSNYLCKEHAEYLGYVWLELSTKYNQVSSQI